MASTRRHWHLLPGLLFALLAFPIRTFGQPADPKAQFAQSFTAFNLDLDGEDGDEGRQMWSHLEEMERGLERWDATIRSYETAMALELRSAPPGRAARMHAALGGIYLDRNRVADALREFVAAIQLDRSTDVYTLQGLTYLHPAVNDALAGAQAFRAALALDPLNPIRAYVLAAQLIKIGASEEAKKAQGVVRDSLTRGPGEPGGAARSQPFVRLGLIQERSGVEPFFPPTLYAEGFALFQRGDYKQAIAQFKEAAARDPLTAEPVQTSEAMGRAATAFRAGLVDVAVQHLKVAIELAPDRAEAHRILGRVYLANQQYDEAVEETRIAVKLSPRDERTRLGLADALVEADRFPEAEQSLSETIATVPNSGRAHYALARLRQRQSKLDEALNEFRRAITFNPFLGLNGVYQAMGAISSARQNFATAIESYAKRVDIHPNDANAHFDLGETYVRLGRYDDALVEFAVTLVLDREHSGAYAEIALVHLRNGRYEDAAAAAQRAVQLDPAHRQARYALATSLMRLDRADEAKRELEVFQRLQDAESAAQSRQLELDGLRRDASVAAGGGNHEQAVSLLRKALVLEPDAAVSYLNLGIALLHAGHLAEAVERLKTAAMLNGPLDVYRYLAEAYKGLGQVDEGRRELAEYQRLKQESLRRSRGN